MHLHVRTCKLVHVSGVHCHLHTSSTRNWLLCTLLYSAVQNTVVQHLYFKPRMSRSKCKSNGDEAGTAKKSELLYHTTVLFKVQ